MSTYTHLDRNTQEEKNWGLFRKEEDGRKTPFDVYRECTVPVSEACIYPLTQELLDWVDEDTWWLAYLPREGSTLIAIDLDNCLDENGDLKSGTEADEVYGDYNGPDGVTPSRKGLRIMVPRHADYPVVTTERRGIGYYGKGGVGVTVPRECLDGIVDDEALVNRVLEQVTWTAREGISTTETDDKWSKHWLAKLSDNEQPEVVTMMLDTIDGSDYHQWRDVGMAMRDLEDRVRWDVYGVFDRWSSKWDGYNAEQNEYLYHKFSGAGEGNITVFTLVALARQAGFDISPYTRVEARRVDILANAISAGQDEEYMNPLEQQDHDLWNRLHERYVWCAQKGQVYDLTKRGYPLVPLITAAHMHKQERWQVEGLFGPVGGEAFTTWKQSDEKWVTYEIPHCDPTQRPGWTGEFINTYAPFTSDVAPDGRSGVQFTKLVRHVYPDDHEWVMDWLATKVQQPWMRQTALVNYTPIGGTGRTSTMNIMRALIGNSIFMDASRMVGKSSNQFNAYMDNLLVCINEVAEGADPENMRVPRQTYERLKALVDPDHRFYNIERKNLEGQEVEVFTSFMIATNNVDAIPLAKNDRRFSVTKGNSQPLPISFRPWLATVLGPSCAARDAALADIQAMLMGWQISKDYQPQTALESEAKREMISANTTPMDQMFEDIAAEHEIVTAKGMAEIAYRMSEVAKQYGKGRCEQMATAWCRKHCTKPTGINAQGVVTLDGVKHRVWAVTPREWEPQLLRDFLTNVSRVKEGRTLVPKHLKPVITPRGVTEE